MEDVGACPTDVSEFDSLPTSSRWLSGRVSDSGARGPGFETYLPCCVLEQDTLLPESTG